MIYKFICTCFLLLLGNIGLYAQHTEQFEIPLSKNKIANSLYNSVKLLDSRSDTTNLGIIQTGAFNRKAKVIPAVPLSKQFAGLLNSLTDETAQHGELLLQLRQCSFAELTGAMTEKGYFYFRAMLYAKAGGQYQKIGMLDTVVQMKSSIDVTRGLLKNGSGIMQDFLARNLVKKPESTELYSYQDVVRIDSIEKSKIRLYNVVVLTEGLYNTYEAFMNQKPDGRIQLDGHIVFKGRVKEIGEDGKLKKLQDTAYSIVHQGQAYVVTKQGYYPIEKKGNDFLFTGKAQVTANAGSVITASLFFGIIGGLIASNENAMFEMKIDHLNGGFIRLREVKDAVVN